MAHRTPRLGRAIPTPGSPDAKRRGCLCPRLDNTHGAGLIAASGDSETSFWVTDDCPLHRAFVRSATTFVTNGQRQNVNTP
jgi:hypothetical protein